MTTEVDRDLAAGDGREPGRRLRAVVVGAGFVGPHHVDAIRRGGRADVVALVGVDPERTAERARALGVGAASVDLAEILRDPSIDVVHVCTPNQTHAELAAAVLEAGKHLVLEKPVAISTADATRLVELADRTGRHAAVALTYRGYPMVRRARAIVAAGEIGDLRLVHGAYLQDWLARPTDYNWRLEPAAGGPSRAVADIGTHWFDTAEFIAGRRIEFVLADLATFIPTRLRPTRPGHAFETADGAVEEVTVRSEDAATILVRFGGGARGAFVVSQVSPGRKNAFSLDLAGSVQSLGWEQELPERLWLRAADGARMITRDRADADPSDPGVPALPAGHPEGWGDALRDLLRPFYAAVASGLPPGDPATLAYPGLRDGARGVAFVDAVLASAKSGTWVEIGVGA